MFFKNLTSINFRKTRILHFLQLCQFKYFTPYATLHIIQSIYWPTHSYVINSPKNNAIKSKDDMTCSANLLNITLMLSPIMQSIIRIIVIEHATSWMHTIASNPLQNRKRTILAHIEIAQNDYNYSCCYSKSERFVWPND